jgi:predicted nuclease of predicted toxin-antitoxin system
VRRVLLDVCVPRRLQRELRTLFVVETAQDEGLRDVDDGPLLDAMTNRFDVLVTRDRNLEYQQRVSGRGIAVVVLVTRDQSSASFLALVPGLKAAISGASPGTVSIVQK